MSAKAQGRTSAPGEGYGRNRDMSPLLLAIPAFLLLAGGFLAVILVLGGIEDRLKSLPRGITGDNPYQDARDDLGSLSRQSRGLGSVLGIGAAFTALLFVSNLVVAADVAAHTSTTVFDVEEVTAYFGYGAVALFLLMFAATVLSSLRTAVHARKMLQKSQMRDGSDPARPLETVVGLRRRFLLFLPLYALLLVPMALVLR